MMLSRRRLFAAAAAAPVALKEAAGKMGLEKMLGGSLAGVPLGGVEDKAGNNGLSGETWMERELRDWSSPRSERDRRHSAEWQARNLDADIASFRSVSPAAAYRIQVERCIKRTERDRKTDLRERIEEQLGDRAKAILRRFG